VSKPTVHDIARAAGVSLATVDRVLNARQGVRTATVERVREAVDRLGYVRDDTAANLARQRSYRFAFVLPDGNSQFHQALRAAVSEAGMSAIGDRITVTTRLVPEGDAHVIAAEVALLDPERVDGVAIMAPETPPLRDAIAHLKERGLPVVAFVSDLPNSGCDGFVGVNGRAAGRTAAALLGRFAAGSGEILVVAGSLQSRDSLERRHGFDAAMAEAFPGITVLPTVETYGDGDRLADILSAQLTRRPAIAGIYSIATGTRALVHAVAPLRTAGRPAVIVHELTPFARTALIERQVDAVITQDVGHLARSALRILRARRDARPTIAAQERIRIEIILRENLP
jgi:LacI family transcriptional regulator